MAGIGGTIDGTLACSLEARRELPLGWFDRDQSGQPDQSTVRSLDPAATVTTYDLTERMLRDLATFRLTQVRRGDAIGFNDTDLLLSPQLYGYELRPLKVMVALTVTATSSLWNNHARLLFPSKAWLTSLQFAPP